MITTDNNANDCVKNEKAIVAMQTKATDRQTVLLIDDDIDYLLQQKIKVEEAGYDVLTADTEQDAKRVIEQEAYDLAVVDLMMENYDAGFTLCHLIKAKNKAIPVVLVTSVNNITELNFDATTAEERSWIKADAFLDKPIRFEQLKLHMDRLLKG